MPFEKVMISIFFIVYFTLVWANGAPSGAIKIIFGKLGSKLAWLQLHQSWRNFSNPGKISMRMFAIFDFENQPPVKIECFQSWVQSEAMRSLSSHKFRKFMNNFMSLKNQAAIGESYKDYLLSLFNGPDREKLVSLRLEILQISHPAPGRPQSDLKTAVTIFREWKFQNLVINKRAV